MREQELAKIFIENWESVCTENRDHLLKDWTDASNYTSRILYEDDSVVLKVAERMGLSVYSECRAGYYGIDAVMYKEEFKVSGRRKETWLKKIEVAIEHENYYDENLFTEICRLLTCNSTLKVLITYPKMKSDEDKNYELFLDGFKNLFENLNESVLIILGFRNTEIVWKNYTLNKDGLKEFNNYVS